jgi:hypothetical protein
LIFICLDKSSDGTVEGSFDIIWEKAGRKLFHAPVILNAFATDPLAAAWFPGTVALLLIFFDIAFFHG